MDFRQLISPKSQVSLAAERQSMIEFQALAPKPMAAALLQASRQLIDSGRFSSEHDYSYDEWALYRVIPAMARMLDPEVELRETEIAKEDERRDPLTWVADADVDKIKSSVDSLISHASLRRAELGSQADKDAAELLLGNRRQCAMSVAMDRILPGSYPARAKPDTRAPLTGRYLIATSPSGRDGVLRYSEAVEELEDMMQTAIAIREGRELTDDEERLKMRLHHVTADLADCTSISIQDFDGKILSEKTFAPEPEPQPEF